MDAEMGWCCSAVLVEQCKGWVVECESGSVVPRVAPTLG
jgi:hypothetical protein